MGHARPSSALLLSPSAPLPLPLSDPVAPLVRLFPLLAPSSVSPSASPAALPLAVAPRLCAWGRSTAPHPGQRLSPPLLSRSPTTRAKIARGRCARSASSAHHGHHRDFRAGPGTHAQLPPRPLSDPRARLRTLATEAPANLSRHHRALKLNGAAASAPRGPAAPPRLRPIPAPVSIPSSPGSFCANHWSP
jgi:hypothetical protein